MARTLKQICRHQYRPLPCSPQPRSAASSSRFCHTHTHTGCSCSKHTDLRRDGCVRAFPLALCQCDANMSVGRLTLSPGLADTGAMTTRRFPPPSSRAPRPVSHSHRLSVTVCGNQTLCRQRRAASAGTLARSTVQGGMPPVGRQVMITGLRLEHRRTSESSRCQ
eukprot:3903905-Rhodomonas_salina.4